MKETLKQLQKRAADAQCTVELEFNSTCSSEHIDSDQEEFIECGSYTVTFKPYPRVEAPTGWGGIISPLDGPLGKDCTTDTIQIAHPDVDFEWGLPGLNAYDYFDADYVVNHLDAYQAEQEGPTADEIAEITKALDVIANDLCALGCFDLVPLTTTFPPTEATGGVCDIFNKCKPEGMV